MRITLHTGAARVRALFLVTMIIVCAGLPARAQVFYSTPGAKPVTDSSPALGAVAGFGDNIIRLAAFARFNFSDYSDLGLEVVYDDVESDFETDGLGFWGGGVDFRYLIVEQNESAPLDISLGGGAGFQVRSDFLHVRVPLGGTASRDFILKDGRRIVPYGGVFLTIGYTDYTSATDTEVDVELRLGVGAEIIRNGSIFAAFHAGIDEMFLLGFNAAL